MNSTQAQTDSKARPAGWNRASAVLLALAAALSLVYGVLYMHSRADAQAPGPADAKGGPSGDIRVISARGESVTVTDHLAPGKFTIIDFYADWCLPCRQINPYLESLARLREDVALRKVNIEDWDNPVVAQYRVSFLPYLRLYGPEGDLVADGADAVLGELRRRY